MYQVMNKYMLYTVACCVGLLAVGTLQAKETIRLSTYVNENDIRYEGFQYLAKLVAEKTDGELDIRIFPSATLHGWSEGVDAVQGGISDISWIPADNRLSCYRVTSLYPMSVDLTKQAELDNRYAELIKQEAAENDLVPLFNSNYSYDQEWWFKEPVTQLNKLDGKLVRSIGPLVSMMIESWGGKPVFVAPKEVFQSAERGVVDGINMGVATYSSWKLWDVMPHMVNANLFYGNIIYMMNKDRFDGLSAAHQKVLLQSARETEEWLQPRYEQWVNERVGNAIMQGGGSAVSISRAERNAMLEKIQPSWNEEVVKGCGEAQAATILALFENYQR